MILKVMVGQRWHHVYKCNNVYNSEIVEVMSIDTDHIKGKTVQIFESTNNDAEVCKPAGSFSEYYSIPYGNSNNVWDLLQNQDAPKE